MEGFWLAVAAHPSLMLFDAPHHSNSLEITYKHTLSSLSLLIQVVQIFVTHDVVRIKNLPETNCSRRLPPFLTCL